MTLGTRINYLIKKSNATQAQIASNLSIANTTLSGYINDYREPSLDILIRIAAYFNVSTDYLLGIDKVKSENSISRLDFEKLIENLPNEQFDLVYKLIMTASEIDINQ